MPRYDVVRLTDKWDGSMAAGGYGPCPAVMVASKLRGLLRPGDRVVSVYPNGSFMYLEALIELRHPSWAAEGLGFETDEGSGAQQP